MVKARDILNSVEQIVERFQPQQIILFGSYAYGRPTDDSDVDLLVVKRYRGKSYRAASRMRAEIDNAFPLDLLIRSPAEVSRRQSLKDGFICEIFEKGIVLDDAADEGVGRKGGRRLRHRIAGASVAQTSAA